MSVSADLQTKTCRICRFRGESADSEANLQTLGALVFKYLRGGQNAPRRGALLRPRRSPGADHSEVCPSSLAPKKRAPTAPQRHKGRGRAQPPAKSSQSGRLASLICSFKSAKCCTSDALYARCSCTLKMCFGQSAVGILSIALPFRRSTRGQKKRRAFHRNRVKFLSVLGTWSVMCMHRTTRKMQRVSYYATLWFRHELLGAHFTRRGAHFTRQGA